MNRCTYAILGICLNAFVVGSEAWADARYTNAIFGEGYSQSADGLAPWSLFHPGGGGFASNQGVSALDGNGGGVAVHTRAVAPLDNPGQLNGQRSDSTVYVQFMLQRPLFANIPVTISGDYQLEVFGRGSTTVEGYVCQPGNFNLCGVQPNTILARLPFERIISNLSPTNEARVMRYFVHANLPANTLLTMKLFAQANAFAGNSRAYLDPVIEFDDPSTTLVFGGGAIQNNPDFVPLVPEPSSGWLLLAAGSLWYGRRHRAGRTRVAR